MNPCGAVGDLFRSNKHQTLWSDTYFGTKHQDAVAQQQQHVKIHKTEKYPEPEHTIAIYGVIYKAIDKDTNT